MWTKGRSYGSVNNREAGDLRRRGAHYYLTLMNDAAMIESSGLLIHFFFD